jgi:hypothetical protein
LSLATVITTYIRENNGSAVPANSTTIYANTTGYPTSGVYGPSDGQPWVTVPGVPYTLLPDSFDPIDYARTSIDNVTAMTFPGTDLVIQQPTAYNEWFQIAVFTTTPDLSAHPSQSETGMTAWPASMCGSYEYDYDTVTQTITSGGEVTTTKSTMSTPRSSRLVPSGKDYSWLFLAAFFGGTKDVDDLNVTYIEPQATPWDGGKALVDYPTGLLGWLGGQEDIVAKHPYITDCFTVGHGDGQPTVHVPVNALTVTSSHIIDVQKAPSPTTSPSAVKPTESAHTEIEDSFLDQPPSPSPTTSPSAVKPTETAHTEIEGTALDQPPSQSPTTTSTSAVKPAESAHTEIEETSLDQPPPSNTITILDPSAVTTTASAPHTENQGLSLDLPAPPPSPSATKQTRETSPNIPGMTVHTEPEHTSVGGPKTTDSRMPKAHTEQSEPVLDVPTRSQIFTYRPSSALPAQASDAAAGKESSSSRPGGVVVVVADDDDKNDNDSKQQPSQGSSSDGNDNNNGQNNGIGGLISAIQSVASQQAAASTGSQEITQDDDASARPAAAVTDNNASGPRPSITGFVVGSQTLTPGGAALTQGGSTFTALPSGSGLQVVAQSSTLRLDGVVPPGMFAVPGVVQKPDSEDEYLVGNNAVSAGGPAVTVGKETFSALLGGSGVQVVNGDGQTRTESVVAVASIDSSPVRSGEDDGQYVFGDNTLSVGGQALTIDGTTFSALLSLSGVAVVDEGQTSTVSLGGTVDFLTVTGASVTAFATPVLLPDGDNNNGGDSDQQLVTLGGSTYAALVTKGSLLVVNGQTVNPGETTVIHGETVVLSGTSLVVAKATASSTHGLGDAIISGLGGGSSSSSSSLSGDDEDQTASSLSGPNAEETGASSDGASNEGSDDSTTDQSGAVPGVQVAVGCLVASAVFALALM